MHSWLKQTNEDERCSKASSKTRSHSSRSSRRSSKSNNSGSCRSDRIEGKVKLAELLEHEAFFEKRQVENKAQRMRMQEKIAKARARAKILENDDFGDEQELQGEILGNRQQSLHSRQTKKENSEASHSQQNSDYLNPMHQAEQRRKGFLQKRTLLMHCIIW